VQPLPIVTGNQENQRLIFISLILLIFMVAAFCGKVWRILVASGFGWFRHGRSTDLSTENVHNPESPDRLRSYSDFTEIRRASYAKSPAAYDES
jgi:hypothetical protein